MSEDKERAPGEEPATAQELVGYGSFQEADENKLAFRFRDLYGVWLKVKIRHVPAELRKYVGIDQVKLFLAVGRYGNDLVRLKKWHRLQPKLHRAKVTAYHLKWILHAKPIYNSLTIDEFDDIEPAKQQSLVDLNYQFALHCIFFLLEALDPQDFAKGGKYERVVSDLFYYMKTGAYNEKMAALLFDGLLANCPQKKADDE